MCGLFGFLQYGDNKVKNLSELTNALAEQSAARGTDATGISYCNKKGITVLKESKSAYMINFKHSDDVKTMIGHTRHSTQGSEKKNYNNHPFYGKVNNTRFTLAHNGIISNDKELKKKYHLSKTKIETDSYVAVQLIERQKQLNFDSIKYMAELLEGSFSFSILDDMNNIYLVKGDSPLSILHFSKLKLYVYASTEEILYKALVDSPLFIDLKNGEFEEIKITAGDILKICSNGIVKRSKFEYTYSYGMKWWDYGIYENDDNISYIDDLKSIASSYGYSSDDIDSLLAEGFDLEEIEEYLYCGLGCEI